MTKRPQSNRVYRFGNRKVDCSELLPIQDSTDLWRSGDISALRQRLSEDGVIFIRGLVPHQAALSARNLLLKTVHDKGALASGTDYRDGIIASKSTRALVPGYTVDAQSGGLTDDRDDDVDGWLQVGTSTTMRNIYDGTALRTLLIELFGGKDMFETLPENTWLRLKGKGDVTVEHADYFYFKRSTDMFTKYADAIEESDQSNLCPSCQSPVLRSKRSCGLCHQQYHTDCIDKSARLPLNQIWHCSRCADQPMHIFTCWTSLSQIDVNDSTLAFVPGTHKLTGFDRVRPKEQVPTEYSSFLRQSAFHIADGSIQPGDIFLFNIKTVHCASENATGAFRASVDTRIQLTAKGRHRWEQLQE